LRQVFILFALFITQSVFYAYGQAPAQTADGYIRPYTEDFQYGSNIGYYNNGWNDETLAGLVKSAGGHTIRPTLPESFLEQYGYDIRASTFTNYTGTLGMKELTCFVEGPSQAHRDPTVYPGCSGSSKLFAHLYEPIWNGDGSVNANNYYAIYLYKMLQIYGDKVRFWEIVNEPDFTTGSANMDSWLTKAPNPNELANIQAPFYNYIRMLRISYEVIKKYHPEAYITTGGVGYPQFADALLRYTDNPADGSATAAYPRTGGAYLDALCFHSYPSYSLHYWDIPSGTFKYTRNSDFAAAQVMKDKQAMTDVLTKYGYNGTQHPTKYLLLSETNVARRTSEDRTGSDEMQRSFGIKTLVLAQKNNIRQLYFYSLGEMVNAPPAGQSVSGVDEIALMGLYENLTRDAAGSQKMTLLGQAFATTSNLLYGYSYDAARTAALALPNSMEGAAFSKNGAYRYVLWAKALTDNSEYATATYSFPTSLGIGTVQRREWDYASSNATTSQSAQSISLTATPSFFEATTTVATTTPTPTPTPTAPVPGSGCAGTGSLLREQWDNVSGTSVASIPLAATPSSAVTIPQFEASGSLAVNYGARLRGYICPPLAGTYSFWLSADDTAELWLSSDADPTHKVRLATCQGWTSGPHDFSRYASQQSAPVTLAAGQKYYVEVLHKQGWGPGYVAVAWLRPDGVRQEPIPGASLIPFASTTVVATPTVVVTPTTGTISTKARITVTFASTPASASSHVAPTLYNKTRVLNFEEDDSPIIAYTDLFPLLQGGSKSSTGQWCGGLRFTDGCGHSYPYTAAVAINGHNPYNNSEWLADGASHDASKLNWTQAQSMLNANWDIENHSDLHTADNPTQQFATLDALITARLQGYKSSIFIVPTNFGGYCTAAFAAGYTGVSSASQSDYLPFFNQYNDGRILVNSLPTPGTPFVYRRYLADLDAGETDWSLLNRLKTLSDNLMAPGTTSSDVFVQRVFTHNISFNTLSNWLTYTQSIAQDQLWVTTLREFSEYRRVSKEVIKTETLSGNTLTIDVDYANLSANTRFQNLSLVIDSPGKIQSITVAGADSSSYNTTTGLVNIFRHQGTTAVVTTTTPTTPVPGSGCAGTGSLLREQWDNVSGTSVASIPLAATPSSAVTIPQFEASGSLAVNYGARLRGYICPPLAGTYSFWLSADDTAELWLSSDADPTHKVRLATCQGWTSGPHDFSRYASQQSAPVTLAAGQKYYVEVLHKQGWGPGYVAVAWLRPDGVRQEPIPGASLIPFVVSNGNIATTISNAVASVLPTATDDKATGSDSLRTRNTLSVFPNPFSQQATVQFSVVKTGVVNLTLLNIEGQLVSKLYSGSVEAGTTQAAGVKADGLPNGLYVLRLVTPTGVLYQKVSCSSE